MSNNTRTAETTSENPNPFDPANLRVSQDFASTGATKRLLTVVPCRKPGRQEFVRVRPGEEWRLTTMVLEEEATREIYLVDPSLHAELADEARLAHLFTTINRQGCVFLWRINAAMSDGSTNTWNDSALAATISAEEQWVNLKSKREGSYYEVNVASGNLTEPEWPEENLADLLRLCFKDRMIDDINHELLRTLRGEE